VIDERVEWLNARLDELEHVANEARHGGVGAWHQTDPDRESGRIEDGRGRIVVFDEGSPSGWGAEHITLHDPRSVLARVEADRRILAAHLPDAHGYCPTCDDNTTLAPCATLAALLSAHRHAPEFKEEWLNV